MVPRMYDPSSVNLKITCNTQGCACVRVAKSQGIIINAVKHSLLAHSLISANEEGGAALPSALLRWKFELEQFTRALD